MVRVTGHDLEVVHLVDLKVVVTQPLQRPVRPVLLRDLRPAIVSAIDTLAECLELIVLLFLAMPLATEFQLRAQVIQDIQLCVQVDDRVFLQSSAVTLGQVLHRIIRITVALESVHLVYAIGRIQLDRLLERAIIRIILIGHTVREVSAYFQQAFQRSLLETTAQAIFLTIRSDIESPFLTIVGRNTEDRALATSG